MSLVLPILILLYSTGCVFAAPKPKQRNWNQCVQNVLRDPLPENPIFKALAEDDVFRQDPNGFRNVAQQFQCLSEDLQPKIKYSRPPRGQRFMANGEQSRLAKANEKVDSALFDGDVVLTPQQFEELTEDNNGDDLTKRFKRKVDANTKLRWKLPVNYQFDSKISSAGKRAVQQAMEFWEKNTCVRFKQARGKDHIKFTKSDGCWSYIGKQGGGQSLSIGSGCEYMDIAAHEIAHAMGFYHEQSRSDRDKFIRIARKNIESANIYNFEKMKNMNDYRGCYDYGSVMHYQANAFGKDSHKPSMVAADPMYQDTMGSWFISFNDVLQMNKAYNCQSKCQGKPALTCENGGYQDPNNCALCKCPYGFDGKLCTELMKSSPSDCGGRVLDASPKWQKLNLATRKQGDCYFQIDAPKGEQVEMRFSSLSASCEAGCSVDFVEIKTGRDACKYRSPLPDFQRTGFRFCCLAPKEDMISVSNKAVIIVHTGKHVRFELQYKIKESDSTAEIDDSETDEDKSSSEIEETAACTPKYAPWALWSRCCGGCPQARVRECMTSSTCPCDESDLVEERDCCSGSICSKCNNGGSSCCDGYSHIWSQCVRSSGRTSTRTRGSKAFYKCRK